MRHICLLLVVACSSRTGEPERPRGSGAASRDADVAVDPGPSERECADLIGHAIAIKMTELAATKPAEQLPTEADLATLTSELRGDAGCRALSRDGYRCAIQAATLADLEGCYTTRSNSTSNSSVAPGGMTLPAPRSP